MYTEKSDLPLLHLKFPHISWPQIHRPNLWQQTGCHKSRLNKRRRGYRRATCQYIDFACRNIPAPLGYLLPLVQGYLLQGSGLREFPKKTKYHSVGITSISGDGGKRKHEKNISMQLESAWYWNIKETRFSPCTRLSTRTGAKKGCKIFIPRNTQNQPGQVLQQPDPTLELALLWVERLD